MIDEKKIEEAAEKQLEDLGSYGLNEDELNKASYISLYREEDVKEAFIKGTNWFLDNLWHPMSEVPEIGSEILIKINKKVYEGSGINPSGAIKDKYDYHDDWEFYANDARFMKWLYIDDLLKGGANG